MHNSGMIYGGARVSIASKTSPAPPPLKLTECTKNFREKITGTTVDRPLLRKTYRRPHAWRRGDYPGS